MTSEELHKLSEAALVAQVHSIDVFAAIEPNQKEMIIHALKKAYAVSMAPGAVLAT